MASLRIDLPDGSQAIVPDWSLESTADSMLTMLTTLTKENKEGLKALLEQAKSDSKDAEKRHKELIKDGDLLHKVTEGLGKEFAKALLKEDNKTSDINPEVLKKFLKLR